MKPILLATDGSPSAEAARAQAIDCGTRKLSPRNARHGVFTLASATVFPGRDGKALSFKRCALGRSVSVLSTTIEGDGITKARAAPSSSPRRHTRS